MLRASKIILGLFLLVFVLACNVVTRPVQDAQEAVATVQSLATAIPVDTLQAFPSAIPDIEMPTGAPDIGNMADPKDPPLTEWNGVPIMPSATAGSESSGIYSFKAASTIDEALEFYKTKLTKLGWTEFFVMPDTGNGALLTYEKDGNTITITITKGASDGETLVFLMYQ